MPGTREHIEDAVPQLSAIIITYNEAHNIADCLASVAFCDEHVVVDRGSEDDTVAIAKQFGARVETHAWEGFGAQKNFALSLATGDWVLSLDADERVPAALAEEIRRAVAAGRYDSYEMPRLSSFCGRPIRHSGWYPDYAVRLFRRVRARFSDSLVHEQVLCDGPVGRLTAPLHHTPVVRLEDMLSRIDRYSTAGAQMLVDANRRVFFFSGIGHGLWAFLRTYVFRGGFREGAEGLMIAVATAEGAYYKYMKAWLEQRRRA